MISKEKIDAILKDYKEDVAIATICSHSALQIFHGAKQEGMRSIGIVTPGRKAMYDAFPGAKPDEYIEIESFSDMMNKGVQQELVEKKAIIVPHGSFVEYVGPKEIEKNLEVPILGNRKVLDWEADREKQRDWLKKAGCTVPKRFKDPSKIDCPAMVKLAGAKGGHGSMVVLNEEDFHAKIGDRQNYIIQEFIIGTRYYPHFFYSPLFGDGMQVDGGRLELLGMDRRIESNIDELHRFGFTRDELKKANIERTFVVTGNLPLVLRESLLPKVLEMGEGVINVSRELFSPGMVGPFCLEAICTPELELYVFEISARIVAGTNLFPLGGTYSHYLFDEPMSTGRRIAREVKIGMDRNLLDKVVY